MKVYLGMGSNVGRRQGHLRDAILALSGEPGLTSLRVSSLYETEHLGSPAQSDHLNACVEAECALGPTELLARMQRLERIAGRAADSHGEARTLDLDLLLSGDCVLTDPRCTLPHPRMHQRRFVLEPLHELAPGLALPGVPVSLRELLVSPAIAGQRVRRVLGASWWQEEMAAWTI